MTRGCLDDRSAEWREGWPLVLAASTGMSVAPLTIYTLGLFMVPLQNEFGWSRATISAGSAVNGLIAVLFAPFMGALIDKVGPRIIALSGLALFSSAFSLLGTASGSVVYWLFLWVLVSLGMLALKPTVWAVAVTSRFRRSRGLALAITLSGSSLTGMLAPNITGILIDNFGWRWAYVLLVLIWGSVTVPLVGFFFFGQTDLGRRKVTTAEKPPSTEQGLTGMDRQSTFLTGTFIKLALSAFLSIFTITAMIAHLVPFLSSINVAQSSALALASFLGGSALAGRVMAGFLLDRVDARIFGAILFTAPAFSFAILLTHSAPIGALFSLTFLLGLSTGAELEIASFLTARYFGLRNFGFLFGTIAGLAALGAGTGPLYAGLIFDHFGNYDLLLWTGLACSTIAGVMILSLKTRSNSVDTNPRDIQ